jgi:hypothetical protein
MLCLVMIQPVFASYFIPVPENDLQNVTNSAVEEYRQLSGKERKNRIKAAKEEIKTHKRPKEHKTKCIEKILLSKIMKKY